MRNVADELYRIQGDRIRKMIFLGIFSLTENQLMYKNSMKGFKSQLYYILRQSNL